MPVNLVSRMLLKMVLLLSALHHMISNFSQNFFPMFKYSLQNLAVASFFSKNFLFETPHQLAIVVNVKLHSTMLITYLSFN